MHSRLHSLYECQCEDCSKLDAENNKKSKVFKEVLNTAEKALKHLHQKGSYQAEDINDKVYKKLINETYKVFDEVIRDNDIPEEMRGKLQNDAFIFSGLKTHSQLLEASTMLLDKEGKVRSFEQFAQDFNKVNKNYNQNYLEAEWQFAISSSQSAANWANLNQEGRYYLQYRTANDDKVRDNHRALHDITLPQDDEFWLFYYPPNGWRCRCRVVEVLKDKYEISESEKALDMGEKATTQFDKNGKNKLEIFRFNPGAEQKLFPPKHPYNKVKDTDKIKDILEKPTEYKNTSMQELEEMYKGQNVNSKNEDIIMNNGYVATANSFYINEMLRKEKTLSDNDKKIVEALDSLIKTNQLKNNLILYRNDGIGFIEAHFGSDISKMSNQEMVKAIKSTGKTEFSDNSFYSVSALKEENFFKYRKIHTEIRAKKGTNAFITSNFEESEIILGRNQKFKIVDIFEENNKVKIITETID